MADKKTTNFSYALYDSFSELNEQEIAVVEMAKKASSTAYAPYSKFSVGAAILMDDGEIYTGSNQENIAFPSGLCAERTVLFYVGSNYPEKKVLKLAIYADGELVNNENPISPCGGCRQVIAEVIKRQKQSFQLILCGKNGKTITIDNALDLLPFPFGME